MHARVGSCEGVVIREGSVAVRTREVNRARVAWRRVAIGVLGRDGEEAEDAGGGRRRETADLEAAGGRRVDDNARLLAADRARDRVAGRNELTVLRLQGRAEGMQPL